MKEHVVKPLIIAAIAALLAVGLYLSGIFEPVENMSYDLLRVRMRHWVLGPNDTHPDVVLCTIDDHTVETIGQFPITREWYARLLEAIPGTKIVGMDIFFDQPSPMRLEDADLENIMYEANSLAEGTIPPEQFLTTLRESLTNPDKEFFSATEKHGKLLLSIFMPKGYNGLNDLQEEEGKRMSLAENIHDLLTGENELFRSWQQSPKQIVKEIATRLNITEKDIDDHTISIVNNLITNYDMGLIKQSYGGDPERTGAFLQGEADDEIRRNLNMSQDRIEYVRALWLADMAAPQIYEVYEQSLAEEGDEARLSAVADALLPQLGIAKLTDFRELDQQLRMRFVKEKMIPAFDGAENLYTTFGVTLPLLPLCEAVGGLGFAQVDPDQDGKVRKYPLLLFHDNTVYPALGLAMACKYLDVDVTDIRVTPGKHIEIIDSNGSILRRIPINERGEMYINWAGKWEHTFQKVSFARIIAKDPDTGLPTPSAILAAKSFDGKVVLVGLTATGTHDFNPTPDQARYPMVGAHANVVSQILLGTFVTKAPPWINILAIAAVVFCIGVSSGLASFKANLPLCILTASIYYAASFWAFTRYGIWVNMSCAYAGMMLCYCCIMFYRYLTEEKQKKLVKHIFQHYMTPLMVEELLNNPDIQLGGEKRTATVFFSDVAGFTTISEAMSPEDLVSLLNEYLSVMTDIIMAEQAYLDKYEGDAIMAVFGIPVDHGDHATRACRAALANQRELLHLQVGWEERGLPKLGMRIGLNTGEMIVGNIGSQARLDYTVIGDSVNLASRLEGANKAFGTKIMIGPQTYALSKNDVETRQLGRLRVKGKKQPVDVYELEAEKGDLPADRQEMIGLFQEGLELYYKREWTEALQLFKKASSIEGKDEPAEYYIGECKTCISSPPPEDWQGIIKLETK